MTDLSPDITALLKRRLTGLAVLLLLAFLFALLRHDDAGDKTAQGLKSVVIPLNGDAPALAVATEEAAVAELSAAEEAAVLPAEEPAATPAAPVPVARPPPAPQPVKPAAKPAAKAATPTQQKPSAAASVPPKPAATRWFVVVGAFKDPAAARAIANRVKLAGFKAETTLITAAGTPLTRVRAGPFTAIDKAESARATLIVEGLTKAAVVTEK